MFIKVRSENSVETWHLQPGSKRHTIKISVDNQPWEELDREALANTAISYNCWDLAATIYQAERR